MDQENFNRIQKKLGGVSRRDFLKFCSTMAAAMALPTVVGTKIANALVAPERPPVVWLHGSECTGCTMSLLKTDHPSLEKLIFDLISLDFHETVSAGAGHQAEKALQDTVAKYNGKFILVVEGAIPTKQEGIFCRVGGTNFVDLVSDIASKAGVVISLGSCASWGGVAAMEPNPTGCVGVSSVVKDKTVVSIPGCPPNPYNLLSTIVHYLTFNKFPELDEKNRPKFAYGRLIHEHCERRPHFDNGRFARAFGDEGHRKGYCLYYLGCKGPVTYANCSTQQFGDAGSGCWPVAIGHPCFGCTQEGVGFNMPQFETAPILHATPGASHAPITMERGEGASASTAGLMGAVLGAAAGAGAVYASKLSGKEQADEDEKA
jgi:hydrogenase small subunit